MARQGMEALSALQAVTRASAEYIGDWVRALETVNMPAPVPAGVQFERNIPRSKSTHW